MGPARSKCTHAERGRRGGRQVECLRVDEGSAGAHGTRGAHCRLLRVDLDERFVVVAGVEVSPYSPITRRRAPRSSDPGVTRPCTRGSSPVAARAAGPRGSGRCRRPGRRGARLPGVDQRRASSRCRLSSSSEKLRGASRGRGDGRRGGRRRSLVVRAQVGVAPEQGVDGDQCDARQTPPRVSALLSHSAGRVGPGDEQRLHREARPERGSPPGTWSAKSSALIAMWTFAGKTASNVAMLKALPARRVGG